jgi:murein DD-endopeptidase MepM/ murein hydrolase activator NlpD
LKVSHRLLFSIISPSVRLSASRRSSRPIFHLNLADARASKLRHENRELQTANEQFGKSVENLRTQLRTVEDRTRKLAIIAGITTLDEASQGGSGGLRNDELAVNPYRDDVDKMSFRSHNLNKDLNVLEQKFTAQSHLLSSTPSIAPVRGILTDGFGGRSTFFTGERGQHGAIDISSAAGQPIRSPADGIVVKAEWANGYGNVIFISHGYGYSTRYGHLSSFATKPASASSAAT